VSHGAPVRTWELKCDPCESYLRGDKKPKVIRSTPGDKDKGIPAKLNHVADCDPFWSSTPEGIPLTPDEENIHKIRAEQGQRQLDRLTAFAALKQSGMAIPPQAQWLINSTLEEIALQERVSAPLNGTVLCAYGHDNAPGMNFCGECGIAMSVRGTIAPDPPASLTDVIPLKTLHIATLRKKCREKGLDDKGTKDQLISRLETT
jgi:hypothetical protein